MWGLLTGDPSRAACGQERVPYVPMNDCEHGLLAAGAQWLLSSTRPPGCPVEGLPSQPESLRGRLFQTWDRLRSQTFLGQVLGSPLMAVTLDKFLCLCVSPFLHL